MRTKLTQAGAWLTAAFLWILMTVPAARAQAPNWYSAHSGGTGGGNTIVTDAAGNVYVAGYFSGTATFGATTLLSTGLDDIFLAKMNARGQYEWAVQAGSSEYDHAKALAVDAAGNVYMTGFFNRTATFGPFTLPNNTGRGGTSELFVTKLSPTGQWLWAVASTGGAGGEALTTDASGNVYVTGGFYAATVTFGATPLTNAGIHNLFAAKLSPTGQWLWAAKAGGDVVECGYGIAVDTSGGVYVSGGQQSQTSRFGATRLTNGGMTDGFVARLTPTGQWQWAVGIKGSNVDFSTECVVSGDDLYVTGAFFSDTITLGPFALARAGNNDAFVGKISSAGVWQWALRAGGTGLDGAGFLTADRFGDLYVAGSHGAGPITFGATTLTSAGESDLFVAKLTTAGHWQWAVGAGGSLEEDIRGVAVSPWGTIWTTGAFTSPALAFGPTVLSSPTGVRTMFVAALWGLPTLTRFTPALGAPGDTVTVLGSQLSGISGVAFTGAVAPNFIVTSDTSLRVVVPPAAVSGPLTLTAANGQTTSATSFTVVAPTGLPAAGLRVASMAVFPNPARSAAYLVNGRGGMAQLLDARGHLVGTFGLSGGRATLDLRGRAPGLYLVRTEGGMQRLVIE